MKKIILKSVLILGVFATYSQQSRFTQYMYNTIALNPAYVGSNETLNVFGMYRAQWLGVEGAPQTGIFSIEGLVGKRSGVGVNFTNDKIGISDQSSITVDYSYILPVSPGYKLAFGLSATANLLNIDYEKLHSKDIDLRQENVDGEFSPNIGSGIFLYSNNFYLGVSVPTIFETTRYEEVVKSKVSERLNTNMISGYVFDMNSSVKLKLATLANVGKGTPFSFDLTANLMFLERFVLGAAWRSSGTISALAGFQLGNNLFMGYAYDMERTKLSEQSSGTHEFFIKYQLGKNKSAMVPRFF